MKTQSSVCGCKNIQGRQWNRHTTSTASGLDDFSTTPKKYISTSDAMSLPICLTATSQITIKNREQLECSFVFRCRLRYIHSVKAHTLVFRRICCPQIGHLWSYLFTKLLKRSWNGGIHPLITSPGHTQPGSRGVQTRPPITISPTQPSNINSPPPPRARAHIHTHKIPT